MKKSDFHYELPQALIAQAPSDERSASRLLLMRGPEGVLEDHRFTELPELLRAGDLLVFNNTRVLAARLLGKKQSGGKVEVLVERVLDPQRVLAQIRASKTPRPGTSLQLEGDVTAVVQAKHDGFYEIDFAPRAVAEVLQQSGHMPLPPYIERPDREQDRERYQTVYATEPGAVAAPTAGLHFDEALLQRLEQKGIQSGFVTLHVGAGTFQPVRVDDIAEHRMHQEWCSIDADLCEQIRRTRGQGGRIVAVGTTSVRVLETAAHNGDIEPFSGDTDIFIRPGYQFRIVDALITNFHLPESTLLMLVSAFAGYDNIMQAYRHAIMQQYRFFSYGDAMLLMPREGSNHQ